MNTGSGTSTPSTTNATGASPPCAILIPRTVNWNAPGVGCASKMKFGVRLTMSTTLDMPADSIVPCVSTVMDSGTFSTFSEILRAVTVTSSSCPEVSEAAAAAATGGQKATVIANGTSNALLAYCFILAFPFFEEARQAQAPRKQCRIGSRGQSRSGCITALERARYNKASGMFRGMKRGMVARSRLLSERPQQHEFNGIPHGM